MKISTLITIYHVDATSPDNPLVKIHLTTSDSDLADANFEKMVSDSLADGYARTNKYSGNQVDLTKDGAHLTIKNHFDTQPMEFTIGRGVW